MELLMNSKPILVLQWLLGCWVLHFLLVFKAILNVRGRAWDYGQLKWYKACSSEIQLFFLNTPCIVVSLSFPSSEKVDFYSFCQHSPCFHARDFWRSLLHYSRSTPSLYKFYNVVVARFFIYSKSHIIGNWISACERPWSLSNANLDFSSEKDKWSRFRRLEKSQGFLSDAFEIMKRINGGKVWPNFLAIKIEKYNGL